MDCGVRARNSRGPDESSSPLYSELVEVPNRSVDGNNEEAGGPDVRDRDSSLNMSLLCAGRSKLLYSQREVQIASNWERELIFASKPV